MRALAVAALALTLIATSAEAQQPDQELPDALLGACEALNTEPADRVACIVGAPLAAPIVVTTITLWAIGEGLEALCGKPRAPGEWGDAPVQPFYPGQFYYGGCPLPEPEQQAALSACDTLLEPPEGEELLGMRARLALRQWAACRSMVAAR